MKEGGALKEDVRRLQRSGARLVSISCVYDKKSSLVYHFAKGERIWTLEVSRPKGKIFESIAEIFPSAIIYEREIHDMFGVKFDNPATEKKLLLPDRWKGKPPMKEK